MTDEEMKLQMEKLTAIVEKQQKELEDTKKKLEEAEQKKGKGKKEEKDAKKDDKKDGIGAIGIFFIMILIIAVGALGVYAYQKYFSKGEGKSKTLPGEKETINKSKEAEKIKISAWLYVDNVTFTQADGYDNCLWLNYELLAPHRETVWDIMVNYGHNSKVRVTKYDGSIQEYAFWPNRDYLYQYTFSANAEPARSKAPSILLVDTREEEIKSIVLTEIRLTERFGNPYYDKAYSIIIK